LERGRKITPIKTIGLSAAIFILIFNCSGNAGENFQDREREKIKEGKEILDSVLDADGTTVKTRFNTPFGYKRTSSESNSFAFFLRNLPLKQHGSKVLLYNGFEKPGNKVYCAVVNMDIGDKNLHQCADAIIRLKAEYLYENKQFEKISRGVGEPTENHYKKNSIEIDMLFLVIEAEELNS
jgi:hypothetical protein